MHLALSASPIAGILMALHISSYNLMNQTQKGLRDHCAHDSTKQEEPRGLAMYLLECNYIIILPLDFAGYVD